MKQQNKRHSVTLHLFSQNMRLGRKCVTVKKHTSLMHPSLNYHCNSFYRRGLLVSSYIHFTFLSSKTNFVFKSLLSRGQSNALFHHSNSCQGVVGYSGFQCGQSHPRLTFLTRSGAYFFSTRSSTRVIPQILD